MEMSGARILLEELIHQGVDTIFGYPGGAVLDIYDELTRHTDRLHHVLAAHEQGAAHAADGYARASGKTGVVLATSGPGATNLVTGIANAYLDSVPLVAITGNVSVPNLGKDSFQEIDIVGVTQPIVKHNFMVRDVRELQHTVAEAFEIANSGRKGPVLIDIPKNVQTERCTFIPNIQTAPLTRPFGQPDEKELLAVLQEIGKAKRPFIYAGGGVLAAGAEQALLELSERMNAPVGLSMMGLSALPASYPLNLGMTGMHGQYAAIKAQSECDLLLAVGVRFSDRATGDLREYTKKCVTVHIDIDRAELGKNVRPDYGLTGDVRAVLKRLIEALPKQSHPDWIAEVARYQKEAPAYDTEAFDPKQIIETVQRHTVPDTVIATDVGQHQMWVMQNYRFERPRTLLTSGGLGTMGYGMGAAIGGCIASGRKRTILFTGDGSFGMNLNEMATAVSEQLPLTIVIINNSVLGMVRQWQTLFYEKRYSATTHGRITDFPALAGAFGAAGFKAENAAELEQALKEAEQVNGPALIDCRINKDDKVFPMIPPGRSVKDMMLHS